MATKNFALVWKQGPVAGTIDVKNGGLRSVKVVGAKGTVKGAAFTVSSRGACRLHVRVRNAELDPGSNPTMVSVMTEKDPFTFFLRDVNAKTPVFIPAYGVAITDESDGRSYDEIAEAVQSQGLKSKLQQIESEPEETYEQAAAETREQMCPTWLGLSRDMRIFEVGYRAEQGYWGYINPRLPGHMLSIPEVKGKELWFEFVLGRGAACVNAITRRLEDGFLPILHSRAIDGDIQYDLTAFVTLEKSKLAGKNLRGTHFLVADGHGAGHMFTDKQQKTFNRLRKREENREEENVLFVRAEATNTSKVPGYAWFKNVSHQPKGKAAYDGETGFGRFTESGRVYCISRLNGKPMPQNEVAVLLQPGDKATLEFLIPHQPVPNKRATALSKTGFEKRQQECRAYWLKKLKEGAQTDLPEPVIDEMVKAGLLHLDIVAYGLEPNGSIAATIGRYCPIGSESSPIIQFFDSMGRHDVARRAISYFLEKQHDDGFIQNFGGYMLETGPVLWTMGEHYRYTRDDAWVKKIKRKLIRACEFMLEWRKRNMKKSLHGRGYGLQDGKVADPEDPYHSFMLNGYAYLGMKRVAEMLAKIDSKESKRWAKEARAFKKDIRDNFFHVMARSPVVPLSDGTWVPTAPPWAETIGPVALHAEPGERFSHCTIATRDSLLGPLYLVLQEVIDPDEQAARFLLQWNAELMCVRNVALSQPYYCRNAFVHLKRDEVKPFLMTYYNGFTGLADRETYTWWEHYFHGSPHKTHEEGWFLMQTRWMLWMEEDETLYLLRAVPRQWLEHGKTIQLKNVASYFGSVSLRVESNVNDGLIKALVECRSRRKPKEVRLRLPHPEGRKPVSVEGGTCDDDAETVVISPFKDMARVVLRF